MTITAKPPIYIKDHGDGTYTAFVEGCGFRANSRLPECLDFIRRESGRASGAVPVWCQAEQCWTSEFELREGA